MAKPWFVRLHRWTSMALGLFLLLECVSGAVLLMAPDLMRVGHGDRYHHTAGPNQLTALQALALVERQRRTWSPSRSAVSAACGRSPGTTRTARP